MYSAYSHEEDHFSAKRLKVESSKVSSSEEIKQQQVEELAKIERVLNSELTPNKRAVIETLIQAWEAKSKTVSRSVPQLLTSVEKKKTQGSSVQVRYS
ncbi:MAG: hypothetical protein VKL39_13955 [Leptolyngbyaceae bacterium]|nr:hypothetical protein [Leptolyngbyaceae bacterium]